MTSGPFLPPAPARGRGDAVGDRPIVAHRAFVAPPPDLVDQLARDRLGARLRAGLVAHRDRRAGVGNVGPGEARLDADHVDARLLLERVGLGQQIEHQAGLRGAAMLGAFQHRGLHQQAARLLLALHRLLHQRGGLHRALVAVDMRIGAIAHQRVGVLRHAHGGVGVQVEGGGDRHVGSHHAAQPLEQRALGIVLGLGDHGAVQRQADAVELAGLPRRTDDHVADRLPGFPGELARGRGVGCARPYRLPAVLLRRVDVAADLVLRAGEARHHRLALDQPALAVVLQRCRQFREGVGLMHELRDQDAVRHRRDSLQLRRLQPLRLAFLAVDAQRLEEAADHHVVADGERELDQRARRQERLDRLQAPCPTP